MKHLISDDLWKGSCHDMAKSYCSKEKEYKLEGDNSVQMTNLGNLKQIPPCTNNSDACFNRNVNQMK